MSAKVFMNRCKFVYPSIMILLLTIPTLAQSNAFTYQGRLADGGNPANGQYDFQFRLFDTAVLGTGSQQGTTISVSNTTVTGGIFTVQLDFGSCQTCFNGSPRFLQIDVKLNAGSTFTTLDPRQPITSTPYAIRSQNAAAADGLSLSCVNCVTSTQIGSVAGSVINGAIPVASVPAGSGNYIQNTTSQQASSNFNISGTGSAAVFNASSQYDIGGSRVLAAPPFDSTFGGRFAGSVSTGFNNTFFGAFAGNQNTIGVQNSFFGTRAGSANTTENHSTLIGYEAGTNTNGQQNSFLGSFTGAANTTGTRNTLIGANANVGEPNLTNATAIGFRANVSQSNSVVLGSINGVNGATADTKVGIGTTAPAERFHVVGNTLIDGFRLDQRGFNSDNPNTAPVFTGFRARGTSSSPQAVQAGDVLFAIKGGGYDGNAFSNLAQSEIEFIATENWTPTARGSRIDFNAKIPGTAATFRQMVTVNSDGVGIATNAPNHLLTIGTPETSLVPSANLGVYGGNSSYAIVRSISNDIEGLFGVDQSSVGGISGATLFGSMTQHGIQFRTNNSPRMVITAPGDVGIGVTSPSDKLDVNGIIRVATLGAAGPTHLCRNASNQISDCSSSIRYKSNINRYRPGLDLIARLRPASFTWKEGGMPDIGLIAEEVAGIEPLLITKNAQGEIEGVKYDRVGVALINAVQQQQLQIEAQQEQIRQQQILIDNLKKLVCRPNPDADICRKQ